MPHDWEERYRIESTPWDLGRAHPELVSRIASGELAASAQGARALVPGCGRGWDAGELARAGWRVTALDLVSTLADLVSSRVAPQGGHFVAADALAFEAERDFDLLWEHTFFCAIDPDQRPRYGEMARRLVRPGGRLAALVFPIGRARELGGPPFGVETGDLERALGAAFRLVADEPARQKAPRREFDERFALFERVAD